MLREDEERLFSQWRDKYGEHSIDKDGVSSLDEYSGSNFKVLFILKEANNKAGGGGDLRKFLRAGARSQTWDTITRWVRGIRELEREISWQEIQKVDHFTRKKYLKAIAVMNLKKVPGGSSSNMSEIRKVAEENHELLNEQFALYKPDIVICGKTGTIVKDILDVCNHDMWKESSKGVMYGEYDEGKYIFRFYHPQARYPSNLLHYPLIDSIREVMV